MECQLCNQINIIQDFRHTQSGIACVSCVENYMVNCIICQRRYLETSEDINYLRNGNGSTGWTCTNCVQEITRIRNIPQFTFAATPRGGMPFITEPLRRLEPTSINHRPYRHTIIGTGSGEIIQSARGWSTEIECYVTDIPLFIKGLRSLPDDFGINRDGSLRNAGNDTVDGKILKQGIEITTPILKGKQGENYLRKLCGMLNDKDNTRVDATCGTHIHIDMSDCRRDFETVKRLMAFHWIYETVIMSFLPASRRSSQYCQSLKNNYSIKKISSTTCYDQLCSVWYKNRNISNRYDKKHTRYHGINLHSMFADGHAEVRYHSGTTHPKKIMHWVSLHTRIIDLCVGMVGARPSVEEIIHEGLTPLGRPRALNRLTQQMFDMLKLNEETQKYLLDRQKRFKDQPKTLEVEFIEKDDPKIYEFRASENTTLERETRTIADLAEETLRRLEDLDHGLLPELADEL